MEILDAENSKHLIIERVFSFGDFDDVDLADWPVIVKEPNLQWPDVKKRIEDKVMELMPV